MRTKLFVAGAILLGLFQVSAQASLTFDGANDVVTANPPGISGNSSRTVEAWIKTTKNSLPSSQGGLGQSVIVDWGLAATSSRFTFNILNNNALRLEVQGNGVSGTIPVNDGNWHHVAVTYDNAAATKVSLYVDGVLDTAGNLTVAVNTSTTGNLRIGERVDAVNRFQGSIDEVRIWNFAKTQAQILADMNKEFCGAQTGLVRYYKFNEGAPTGNNSGLTTINDYSGNNANGTAANFALSGTVSNFDDPKSLTLTSIDNTLTVGATFIEANQTGAYYSWYDCATFNLISQGTSPVLSGIPAGSYYAIINYNGCISQSTCATFSLSTTEVDKNKNNFTVYPNPSSGIFNFAFEKNSKPKSISVYDASGKLINKIVKFEKNESDFQLEVPTMKGIYYVQVENEDGKIQHTKLIKK